MTVPVFAPAWPSGLAVGALAVSGCFKAGQHGPAHYEPHWWGHAARSLSRKRNLRETCPTDTNSGVAARPEIEHENICIRFYVTP